MKTTQLQIAHEIKMRGRNPQTIRVRPEDVKLPRKYIRASVDSAVQVSYLADLIRMGVDVTAKDPMVVGVFRGAKFWVNGAHRAEAFKRVGVSEIPVLSYEYENEVGMFLDALELNKHGKCLSPGERRVDGLALREDFGQDWPTISSAVGFTIEDLKTIWVEHSKGRAEKEAERRKEERRITAATQRIIHVSHHLDNIPGITIQPEPGRFEQDRFNEAWAKGLLRQVGDLVAEHRVFVDAAIRPDATKLLGLLLGEMLKVLPVGVRPEAEKLAKIVLSELA